jgi:5-methylcytosine-specific restriction endonuclease McrA
VSAKTISAKLREAVYERDGHKCVYCGCGFESREEDGFLIGAFPTVDHDMPRCRGGKDTFSNLVTACVSCNAAKRDKTGLEFRVWLERSK